MEADIQILFFASLAETLNTRKISVPYDNAVNTVEKLRKTLAAQNATWEAALLDPSVRAAVNQKIVTTDSSISSGDEVAFFPPVTGG